MSSVLEFIGAHLQDWGYVIVFVIAFLETSAMLGLLVPGETVILLAGAVASQGRLDLLSLVVVVIVAGLLGDNTGYVLGRKLGRGFILRHSRIFRVKPTHIQRADSYFERHGGKTILIGRWIGFMRSLAPFLAGSARMSYLRFLPYDVLGVVSWGAVSVLLGYFFGRSYQLVEKWLGRVSLFLVLFTVAAVLLWLLARWLSRRKAQLGGLVVGIADAVLEWRPVRAIRRRFARQLSWVTGRFSPRSAYGLGLTFGLAIAVILGWVLVLLFEPVLSREPITALDRVVALELASHAIPQMTSAMIVLTVFGSALFVTGASCATAAVLLIRRRWQDALIILTASLGSILLTFVLKLLIERPRPDLVEPLVSAAGYSFPSGHATQATAFFLTLSLLAAGWTKRWENRVYILVGGLVMVLLVGFSRLYLGVHYLTDVLAGYASGALWLTVCATAATVLSRALTPPPEVQPAKDVGILDSTKEGDSGE